MKNFLINLLFLMFVNQLCAIAPSWTVDKQQFAYTMTFTGIVNLDGQELSSADDKVAAFVGSQCRGVAQLVYNETAQRYVFFMSVYGSQTGDSLRFKVYLSQSDKVVDLPQQTGLTINENKGSVLRPFTLSNPALNSNVGFTSISVEGQVTASVTDTLITVLVAQGQDIKSLALTFETVQGTKVMIGEQSQTSGTKYDFSAPINLQLISADYSTEQQVRIAVIYQNAVDLMFSDTLYYRITFSGNTLQCLDFEFDKLEIIDINGKKCVYAVNANEIDLSTLLHGMYVARISKNGITKEVRILR